MKPLFFLLLIALLASCQREKPIDECSDILVYLTNWGELYTLKAKCGAPKSEDWAIRCYVKNEGRTEMYQIVIRKGETTGYVEFQSSDKITTFKKDYCGHLDN